MTEAPVQKKPNRRALKAAAAGALGVALLAGLGTTFAKWNEESSIGDSSLQSGHLNMTVDDAKWIDVKSGETIDEAQFKMVPGDTLLYTATVTPDLVGDNLVATLKVNTTDTVTGDLANIVEVTTVVGSGTATEQTVTPADNTPIDVSVELRFPLTDGGADPAADKSNWWGDRGEDGTVNLSEIKIELDQNNNP
ncbi:alternate-type signal peptide domain-containing protein [Brevibacterium luteolum]|uniref:alternate-type signal peptide domain-containing protein n=1 Tax=Brevibacterium luteolum TaxID=199591 RepID=UPI003B67F3B8